MQRPKDHIQHELDAVIGESYDPPRRWKATIAKWIVAAVLGVAASVVVLSILDTHVTKAKKDAAAKRPVPIQIIPGK